MYGLNAVALVFFCCINVLAYQLCKCPKEKRRKIIVVVCAVFLCFNLIRYGIVYPFIEGEVMLPVEFSTVAYFAVPTILLTLKKHFYSWAAYSGLMAGFFYYMAMILAGGPLYADYAPKEVFISLFCHASVYFCGFVTIATEACSTKDAPKLVLGVAMVAIRAILLRPFIVSGERFFIYILLDAAVVRQFLPQSVWALAIPVYYLVVATLVLLTIRGFFYESRKQYHRFSVTVKSLSFRPSHSAKEV